MRQWAMVSEDGAALEHGLSVFRNDPSRYCLVSADDEALAAGLSTPGMLLYWLARAEIDQMAALVLASDAGPIAGVIFSRELLRFHSAIPRRSGRFLEDAATHLPSVGLRSGSLVIADSATPPEPSSLQSSAWYEGCSDDACVFPQPAAAPMVFTCTSNNLYGASNILRAYCGVREYLPIAGRIQHGWEPGPGNVIEAMSASVFDRYYVWSPLAGKRLGLIRAHSKDQPNTILLGREAFEQVAADKVSMIPVGAPYLYLPEIADVGPVASDWLLAVPGHGTLASPDMAHPWEKYLGCVRDFARERGFQRVSVCLYADDDREVNRAIIRSFGFVPVSNGPVGGSGYLGHVRNLIRQHAAVTSDRVCTAIMYALYENRACHIVGAGTVQHDPPDAYADLVTDPDWIAVNYPGIWAGGLAGREEALVELGHRRSPEELKRLLWYWIWEGA